MVTLYRLALLLLAFQCLPVHAYPATITGYMYARSASGWDPHSSPQAVCDAVLASYMGVNPGSSEGRTYSVTESGCSFSFKLGNTTYTYGAAIYKISKYSCPSGGTLTGSECVEEPEDPCDELPDYCKSYANTEREWTISGATSRPASVCYKPLSLLVGASGGYNDRFPGCNRGCNLGTSPGVVKYESGDGQSMVTGYGVFSGADCSLVPPTENPENPEEEAPEAKDPDPTCKNGFKGTVNGVTTCVPAKSSQGTVERETKDNGDGTKTDSETTVKCEGGKCEITKTSTTTNTTTNNTVGGSSTTTTVDKADYCSKNKTGGVCKDEKGEEEGKGKFGGSCSGGFTCEGDALQCAMAKEQHKRSCELHVNDSPESKLYEASKGKTGKVTDDLPGNETIALTDRIDTSSALGAGYCPLRDITVDVAGYSKVLPLSDHCEKIGYVKIFFVSFCLLLGLWIVFGRK